MVASKPVLGSGPGLLSRVRQLFQRSPPSEPTQTAAVVGGATDGLFQPRKPALPPKLKAMTFQLEGLPASAKNDLNGGFAKSLTEATISSASSGVMTADEAVVGPSKEGDGYYPWVSIKAGPALVRVVLSQAGMFADHDPETGKAVGSLVPVAAPLAERLNAELGKFAGRLQAAKQDLEGQPGVQDKLARYREVFQEVSLAGGDPPSLSSVQPEVGLLLRIDRTLRTASRALKAMAPDSAEPSRLA
jgi:hypothetical protein